MAQLSFLLRDKLIPWTTVNAERRLIVARQRMRASQMPEGVQLTRRKLKGPRVIVKNRRNFNNTRSFLALWPEDGLNEVEHLKLVCVLSGRIDFQVGEYLISCGAGHFIFIPPRVPHYDSSRHSLPNKPGQEACELFYLILHPRAVQCWIKHCQRNQKRMELSENSLIQNDHVTQLFRILMERAVAEDADSMSLSAALLPVFFQMLFDEVKSGRYIHPGSMDQKETVAPDTTSFEQQLRKYIIHNIGKTLTMEGVGREMYLSRAQFARRVRHETGKTFVEILTECRMNEAKVLLGESEWTINAISETVGFKAPTYFRRIFRQQMGMTPGEYRKMQRNKN